jgi:UDP-3-O-acyl-N-acetylglucosamine deacetylase
MTIARTISAAGRAWPDLERTGLWLHPAGPGTGIWFNRRERACLSQAGVRAHCTCLGSGRWRVTMVEHLLAACYGLGVTDLAVETDGPGLPVFDGSAAPYVALLRRAGFVRHAAGPEPARLARPVMVRRGPRFAAAVPARGLTVNCVTRFSEFGAQHVSCRLTPGDFARELAPARTFAATRLTPAAFARRLGLKTRLVRVGRFLCAAKQRLVGEQGRHKALDLVGDLALLGRPLNAAVFVFMPGHELNLQLARAIEKNLEV